MKRILAAVLVGFVVKGHAEETGAAFLKISPSVSAEALGGLNPASVTGSQALGVNPGAIGGTAKYELTSGLATMMGESAYGTVGGTLRKSESLTLGAQAAYLTSGSLEGRDANGNQTREFKGTDMAAGVSVNWRRETLGLGATIKGVRQELGDLKSNTATAFDVGGQLEVGNVTWGAAALNLGGKLQFEGGKVEKLPVIYSLGASVPLGGGLRGMGSLLKIGEETIGSGGLEYGLGKATLRAGYKSGGGENLAKKSQKGSAQALGGLTGGIGLSVNEWRLDYAVSQAAVEYGMSHRASVSWRWGGETLDEPARKSAAPVKRISKTSRTGVKTGSRRAYDPAPIRKAPAKKRKTWVY
jgi:hypothetical protein